MLLFPGFLKALQVGVFDAGSTGTRLKVFEFDKEKIISEEKFTTDELDRPENNRSKTNKHEPSIKKKGIHESTAKEIEETIAYLLETSGLSKDALLGFYGTGGLRSISPEEQEKKLQTVKAATKDYNVIECKVLTGNEEALYSLRAFEHLKPDHKNFSIIDMGGKSVQIIQRSETNIKLSSLEMGILNCKCELQKKSQLNNTFLDLFTRRIGPTEALTAYEYKGAESGGKISNYDCQETGTPYKFECKMELPQNNKPAGQSIIFGPGIGKRTAKADNEGTFKMIRLGRKEPESESPPMNEQDEKDRSNTATSLNSGGNALDLSHQPKLLLTNLKNTLNFLQGSSSTLMTFNTTSSRAAIKRKELICIDEFINRHNTVKVDPRSEIYLMSFYEEIIGPDSIKTLTDLLHEFDHKCLSSLDEKCLKFYYAVQFLKHAGVGLNVNLRLMGRIQGLDISWSMGKALELRDMPAHAQ